MTLSKKEIQNLSELLISANDTNLDIALELLKGIDDKEVIKSLASEFFALYKVGVASNITSEITFKMSYEYINKFESFLKQTEDEDVLKAMKSKASIVLGVKAASHLRKLTKDTILDTKKIALIIYNKCNIGLDFLVKELNEEELLPIILKYKRGKELILNNCRLKTIPKVVFELTEIESLSLAHNQIKTITKDIGKLVNLKYLFLDWNPIKKIHSNIKKLTKLEYINAEVTQLEGKEKKMVNELEGVVINWVNNPENPYAKRPYL